MCSANRLRGWLRGWFAKKPDGVAPRCRQGRCSRSGAAASDVGELGLPRVAAVPVHDPIPQALARSEPVVAVAEEPEVRGRGLPALHAHDEVIELHPDA